MEGLNIVDLLVLIIVLLSGTLAYFRGLVRESISIAGWVISALLAFQLCKSSRADAEIGTTHWRISKKILRHLYNLDLCFTFHSLSNNLLNISSISLLNY
jgi:hypothetical protein